MQITITEQNGAIWIAEKTSQQGDRSYWIQRSLYSIPSKQKPEISGFYASNLESAKNAINPSEADRRIDGYNPEFLGAKPAKAGEDY